MYKVILKHEAQQLAKSLGLSLSAIIENKLRQAVRERRIIFEDNFTPNAKTAKHLREIEEDVRAGRNLSPAFNSIDELDEYMRNMK